MICFICLYITIPHRRLQAFYENRTTKVAQRDLGTLARIISYHAKFVGQSFQISFHFMLFPPFYMPFFSLYGRRILFTKPNISPEIA